MFKNKINKLRLAGALLGAIGGFLYWNFIGCESGTCAIRSVWYYSTLWGTAMGYLLADLAGSFLIKEKAGNE